MRARDRRRSAGAGLVLVLGLLLSACQWSLPRFDAAGTANNPFEAVVGVDDVATATLRSSAVAPGPISGGTPVVHGNLVFVTSRGAGGGLRAYPVNGAGCVGSPGTCAPVWSSAATGDVGQAAVAGGVVFVGVGGDLHAYDAAGVTGCSGTPRTCSPLWTAPGWAGEPVVDAGRLFVTTADRLGSFDAVGTQGCTGSPKVCQPAWTYVLQIYGGVWLSPPAVADGVVYVGAHQDDTFINGGAFGSLLAFDATGVEGCSGTPTTCEPLWQSPTTGSVVQSPAIVDGTAYVSGYMTYEVDDDWGTYQSGHTEINGFDVAACRANPDTCTRTFYARSEQGRYGSPYSLAIADGLLHASWSTDANGPVVATFEVHGLCSIVGCDPIRVSPSTATGAQLAVANGVLYSGRNAFDASGATGCTAGPVVCSPIWTAPVPATGNRTFLATNGRVIGVVETGSTQTLSIFATP